MVTKLIFPMSSNNAKTFKGVELQNLLQILDLRKSGFQCPVPRNLEIQKPLELLSNHLMILTEDSRNWILMIVK